MYSNLENRVACLTIVGGVREAWSVWRRGRLGTVCARVACRPLGGAPDELRSTSVRPDASCGPSTSPLDARMRHLLRLVPLALLASCDSPPPHSTQPTTPPRTRSPEHYFDCDVPPGRFSKWGRAVSVRSLRVSGTLELIEPRHDPQWIPSATVLISGKGGTSAGGLRAYLDLRSPEVLHFVLMGRGAPPSGRDVLSLPWQKGQVTPFIVTFNGSGELSVYAGGIAQTLQLPNFDPESVQLICSTGQFKFRQVVVDEQQ